MPKANTSGGGARLSKGGKEQSSQKHQQKKDKQQDDTEAKKGNRKRKEKDREADTAGPHAKTAAGAPAQKKPKLGANGKASAKEHVATLAEQEGSQQPAEIGTPKRTRTPVLLPPTPNSKNANRSVQRIKPSASAAAVAALRKPEDSKDAAGKQSKSQKAGAAAGARTPAAAAKQPAVADRPAAATATKPGTSVVASAVASTGSKAARQRSAAAQLQMGERKKSGRGVPRTHAVSWQEDKERQDVKHGPFSKEEGDAIRAAIQNYAVAHQLDQEDLSWLFNLRNYKGHKGAISTIAAEACPNRKRTAVWSWISRTLRPAKRGKFDKDEIEQLKDLVESLGTSWTKIGEEMGRRPGDCKDVWRELGAGHTGELAKGKWEPDEEEKLRELVEKELGFKSQAEEARELAEAARDEDEMEEQQGRAGSSGTSGSRKSKQYGGQWVRDGINWDWVAKQMETRNATQCRQRWYRHLCPSMIDRGEWGKGDDKVLLKAMYNAGYQEQWEVQWHDLVPGRTSQQCRRRWLLMLRNVSQWKSMSLGEQVAYLVDVYLHSGKTASQRTAAASGAPAGEDADTAGAGTPQTKPARKKAKQQATENGHAATKGQPQLDEADGSDQDTAADTKEAAAVGPSNAAAAAGTKEAGPSKGAAVPSKRGRGQDGIKAAETVSAAGTKEFKRKAKSAGNMKDLQAEQADNQTAAGTSQAAGTAEGQPPAKKAKMKKKGQQKEHISSVQPSSQQQAVELGQLAAAADGAAEVRSGQEDEDRRTAAGHSNKQGPNHSAKLGQQHSSGKRNMVAKPPGRAAVKPSSTTSSSSKDSGGKDVSSSSSDESGGQRKGSDASAGKASSSETSSKRKRSDEEETKDSSEEESDRKSTSSSEDSKAKRWRAATATQKVKATLPNSTVTSVPSAAKKPGSVKKPEPQPRVAAMSTVSQPTSSGTSSSSDDDEEAERRLYQQLSRTAGVYSQGAAEPDSDPDEFGHDSSEDDSEDDDDEALAAAGQVQRGGDTSSSDDDDDDDDNSSDDDSSESEESGSESD